MCFILSHTSVIEETWLEPQKIVGKKETGSIPWLGKLSNNGFMKSDRLRSSPSAVSILAVNLTTFSFLFAEVLILGTMISDLKLEWLVRENMFVILSCMRKYKVKTHTDITLVFCPKNVTHMSDVLSVLSTWLTKWGQDDLLGLTVLSSFVYWVRVKNFYRKAPTHSIGKSGRYVGNWLLAFLFVFLGRKE